MKPARSVTNPATLRKAGSPRAIGNRPNMVGFFRNMPGVTSGMRGKLAAAQPHLSATCGVPDRIEMVGSADTSECSSATRPDGSFLALAGRWYHHKSLDDMLEVWLDEGESCLQDVYFQGLIAGWDARARRFLLLRDRYGVETGYYAEVHDGIVFSDNQRALIDAGVDRTADPVAIDAFLACGYFPAPLTPYRAVSKLAPGTMLSVDGRHRRVERWAPHETQTPIPFEDAVQEMPDVLRSSVERIWPSSGEVGVLLSGGIDSAMVATTITKMLGEKATAFTFKYEDYDGPLNEFDAARVVSSHLGIDHKEISIRPDDLIADLDAAVAAYGEPLNWGLHSYRLHPLVDTGMGAVFSGVGADGTGITKRHRAALKFRQLPGPVRSLVRGAVRGARPLRLRAQPKMEWVSRNTSGVADLFSPDSAWSRTRRARLYDDPSLARAGSRRLSEVFTRGSIAFDHGDPQESLIMMDKMYTTAEAMMAWNRAWPSAHGLTAHFPFFDPDLIDLGLQVEGTMAGKDLIRNVAEDFLPSQVANAPKIAQQMPVSHWLRGPIASQTREILSSIPDQMAEIFDRKQVLALADDHAAGKTDAGWRLISLMTLATWFRHNG